MQGKSYTYLTLEKLNHLCPDADFLFHYGADSLDYFEQWYHPEIICQNAIVLVAVRDKMNLAVIRQKIDFSFRQLFPAEISRFRVEKQIFHPESASPVAGKGQKEASWSLLPDAVI